MTFLHRSFIKRRKFDQWVLALGAVAMPLRIGFGPIVLFLFSCIGIYLTVFRHKSTRLFVGLSLFSFIAYEVWTLGLMAWRDQFDLNNRQIGYTLLLVFFFFAAPGMVLVRDPLRFFALGSRVGILITALLAMFFSLYSGGRIGIGGNQAVFAYAAAIAAISATFPVKNAPRLLANGPQWIALGLIAVTVSETRAILVVLPFILLLETVVYLQKFNRGKQAAIYAALAILLAAMTVTGPVKSVFEARFATMINYYETGNAAQWSDKSSADIRLAMWRGAIATIEEYPLAGVGAVDKMALVQAHATATNDPNDLNGFLHVHNTVLDELLNNGIIGFALLCMAFLTMTVQLWKSAPDCATKRVLIYFVVMTVAYGMLHNPLLHEMTISAIMLFLSVMNADRVKRVIYKREPANL